MDQVMTPFVINCFYFCDPDGKTEFVQSREKMPVDDGTPAILRLDFEDIKAQNCHVQLHILMDCRNRKLSRSL